MLRACVLDWGGNWEKYLRLVEFAYNNSFQARIGMSPYEALYWRPSRTPLCWTPVGESRLFGSAVMDKTTEKMKFLKIKLKEAQERHKELEFQVGDLVYLKAMTYKLDLLSKLDAFHNVFHVSQLRKCCSEQEESVEDIPPELKENMTVEAWPVRIMDRMKKRTWGKSMDLLKVLWNCGGREEYTWETENKMKANFSEWFKEMGKINLMRIWGRIQFKRGEL